MDKNKKLILFTSSYPFGNKETFIANEIEVLSQRFSSIEIFPLNKKEGEIQITPNNVQTSYIFDKIEQASKIKTIFRYRKTILSLLIEETRSGNLFGKQSKHIISSIFKTIDKVEKLKFHLQKENNTSTVFYSFWFDEWATILSILKHNDSTYNYYSRAHGFDLYPEQTRFKKKILFRKFQIKNIEKLFLISKDGLNFISSSYPTYKNKFLISYLGTKDFGMANYIHDENKITILTISSFAGIKRVELLVETLNLVKHNVKWIHIGDGGELKEKIKLQCKQLKNNITIDFKGQVPNDEVKKIMLNENITCFINTSKTEGLPVSIMEATSCGIPTIATDVGGTSEIVTNQTGILIPKDFSTLFLSDLLDNVNNSKFVDPDFRKQVKNFWEENFNTVKNTNQFIDKILNNNK